MTGEFEKDRAIQAVNALYAALEVARAELENERQRGTPKIVAVPDLCKVYREKFPRKHFSEMPGWKLTESAQEAEVAYNEVKAMRGLVTAAIENNRAVKEAIGGFMQSVGFPRETSHTVLQRGRWKTVTELAGWAKDLASIPTSDTFPNAEAEYKSDLRAIAERVRELNEKQAQAQAEATERKVQFRGRHDVVAVCERYGLDIEKVYGAEDIVDALRRLNKYLDLAAAMESVRHDWNDGCGWVRYALESFEVETETDRAIVENLWPYVNDWDNDGRVFRDCAWNYDRIYGLAPAELVRDFREFAFTE